MSKGGLIAMGGEDRDGKGTYWYENGRRKAEVNFKDGKNEGSETYWYENGQKKSETIWKAARHPGTRTVR